MDFSFNETQHDIQKLARDILSNLASTDALKAVDNQAKRFDAALWQQLAQSGLLGLAIEPAHGGMGLQLTELCLLAEEVGRTVAPAPIVPVLVSTAMPIQRFGSDALKTHILPAVASGASLITAGLVEPISQMPFAPEAKACETNGQFVITGTKTAVPFADDALRVLVTAKVNDHEVGVFLIDPNHEGVTLTAQTSTSDEPWFELTMANVAATDVLVIDNGDAAQWIYNCSATAYCAMQLGISEVALKTTADYTCERIQFDVPIGSFQSVQHRVANGFIDLSCLRLTTYQACTLLDDAKDATNEVLIAKIWAGDVGHRISYASQHLHGGIGIDKDYHLWRYSVWARHMEIYLGSSAELLAQLGTRIAQGKAYAS